eukprot:482983_1
MADHLTQQDLMINIIILAFCAISCIVIASLLIRQCLGEKTVHDNNNQGERTNVISSLLLISSVSVITLCELLDLIRHIICFSKHQDIYEYPLAKWLGFADILNYIGSILFYLIAIRSLQMTCFGRYFPIHLTLLMFLYVLIGITGILAIYDAIVLILTHQQDAVPFLSICIVQFIVNITLLSLFIRKSNQLFSNTFVNNSYNKIGIQILQKRNMSIFIARHGLLYSVAIIINQILYLWLLIKIFLIPSDLHIHASDFFYRAIGNTVICMALYLSSHQNYETYTYLCTCFHNRVQKCFSATRPKTLSTRRKTPLDTKPKINWDTQSNNWDAQSNTTTTQTPENNHTLSTWAPENGSPIN